MKILNELEKNSDNKYILENFIKENINNLYEFFNKLRQELIPYKKYLKNYIRTSKDTIFSLDFSKSINKDFIILLLEGLKKTNLLMEFILFYDFLKNKKYINLGFKLEAYYKFIRIKRFTDYSFIIPIFFRELEKGYLKGEAPKDLTLGVLEFYFHIIHNFKNNPHINEFKRCLFSFCEKYNFVDNDIINKAFLLSNETKILELIDSYFLDKKIAIQDKIIKIEQSSYSEELKNTPNLSFESIREISKKYLKDRADNDDLHYKLQRGSTIIEDEILLHKYIFDYGKMHKLKLYDAFNKITPYLNNNIINIIDWGCGQALATSLLIDYIKEKKLNITFKQVILIEPSKLALERGLLHLEKLKHHSFDIKSINKDLDSIEENDILILNNKITLHIFSNILDIENFNLNRLIKIIEKTQKGLNYFLCISPNINEERNARIDIFYNYFNTHYKTELISETDENINNYTRYEKIFKVFL